MLKDRLSKLLPLHRRHLKSRWLHVTLTVLILFPPPLTAFAIDPGETNPPDVTAEAGSSDVSTGTGEVAKESDGLEADDDVAKINRSVEEVDNGVVIVCDKCRQRILCGKCGNDVAKCAPSCGACAPSSLSFSPTCGCHKPSSTDEELGKHSRPGLRTDGCKTSGEGSDVPPVPEYALNLNADTSVAMDLADSGELALLSNPFAQSLAPGFDSGGTDIIGDFLKAGGLVQLNYRAQGIVPTGANPNGNVILSGDRFLFTDNSGGAITPTPGQTVVAFRPPLGTAVMDPANFFVDTDGTRVFQNLQRVVFDDMGGEQIIGSGFTVREAVPGSPGGAIVGTQRVNNPFAGLVNPAVANVGVVKAAEGSNPVPRDRVFFAYSFFDNVPLGDASGISINRFTPGFEKTFFNKTASVEARFPFATTLNSDFNFTQGFQNDSSHAEFGDILLAAKLVLMQRDKWLVSGGIQMSLPTADDLRFVVTDTLPSVGSAGPTTQTSEFLRISNETVHLLPFIAGVWLPDDRWFIQGFVQMDFDLIGKPVLLDAAPFNTTTGTGLQEVGRFNDATFLYADVSVGNWITRDPPESTRTLTGFAPMVELHYNRSITTSDLVQSGDVAQVGIGAKNIEVLNLTLGGVLEIKHNTTLTFGFATPLTRGSDAEFDGEFRMLLSHRFGGSAPPFSPPTR